VHSEVQPQAAATTLASTTIGITSGTQNQTDKPSDSFDTPTLLEVWRTAPYLHDGSAATLREVLVDRNHSDRHGHTSHLTPNHKRKHSARVVLP
jgi:cytochrome c peroxidase